MYFEIYKKGNLIKRGTSILGNLNWSNELMFVPSTDIELPIEYREFFVGREEIKIFTNDKCFWGIVLGIEENKPDETIKLKLEHVVQEWTYRQISVNNAIKDQNINVIFKGSVVGSKGGVNVSANPFDILVTEIPTFTNAKYISRAGAVAWSDAGDAVPITAVDSSKVKRKPGDYNVVFSTANGASVTVKANVKKMDGAKQKTKDGITVTAIAFELTVDEVGTFTKADYIERAYAMAWNSSGEDVTIDTVDRSRVEATVGSYNVKFTAGDAAVKVKAKVLRSGADVTPPDYPDSAANVDDPSIVDQLEDIYADVNMAYPGWRFNMSSAAEDTVIDYVYSRQNKLEALTKTMELTPDLFWRVRFVDERVIDISAFGDRKEWIVSKKPTGANNIRIIGDPVIKHDFENVINLATVYSEKSDSGMSSMTLREVYNDPTLQIDGFPCVILRSNVNNERDYHRYTTQYPKLASNNELEYAVIDEESVALESGYLIEGTYAFNDLAPFSVEEYGETKEITDKDRIEAAKTAYHAAVKRLKQARRTFSIDVTVEELPADIAPGDKVRFIYDNELFKVEECSAYMQKILSYDDWFYITKIDYDIDETEAEVDKITLTKFLKIDRETSNE